MAVLGGFFDEWVVRCLNLQLGLSPAPDNGAFQLILHNNPGVLADTPKAEIITAELPEANGYSRFNYLVSGGDITWDNSQNRAIAPSRQWTITATGASLQWSGVVMLANASPTANSPCTADLGTDEIIAVGHGLTDGDEVCFSTEGAVFGGLTAETIYYVVGAIADRFQVAATEGGTAIPLTNNGSGIITLHHASGSLVAGYTYDTPQSIFNGAAQTFEWSLQALFNSIALGGSAW